MIDNPDWPDGFDALSPADQAQRLRELDRDALLTQALHALDDARVWHAEFRREQAARQLAEARVRHNAVLLEQTRADLDAARDRLWATIDATQAASTALMSAIDNRSQP